MVEGRGPYSPGPAPFLLPRIQKQSDQKALLPVCSGIEGDGIVVVTGPYTPEATDLEPMDEPADYVLEPAS